MAWGKAEVTGTVDFGARAVEAGSRGQTALSVSQAVGAAKARVGEMPALLVTGEVTGFRGPNARSGHCYFQVKDDGAAMDVIVWKGVYATSGIQLRDGMQLQMWGSFDVYVGSGRLSFVCKRISLAGEGLLRQQVAQLARKLEAEGLMSVARKRPIPRFCTRVAVVTSLSGAVIDDVRRTLRRRNPLVELLLSGCQVQGPGAARTVEQALARAAAARPDAILLVRGGGSFEDLMTFNDEALARAVAACPVPVITGIGHEPDTCICDMVADRRTSTPTAAAESVAPALDEIVASIEDRRKRLGRALVVRLERERADGAAASERLGRAMQARLASERLRLDALASRRCLVDPHAMLEDRRLWLMQSEQRLVDALPRLISARCERVETLCERLGVAGRSVTSPHEAFVSRMAATLDALSPLKVLGRGYAIARTPAGAVITDARDVAPGEALDVMLSQGSLGVRVEQVRTQGGA